MRLLLLKSISVTLLTNSLGTSVANPIVEENRKAGAPSEFWDVNGAGDPTIQGFTTEISVAPGEDAIFKVNAPTVTSYRADIYRLGYYGGAGARRISTIRPPAHILPQHQPDCRFENETLLVDCGNWHVSFRWRVPANAVSGLYIARLVREDSENTDGVSWRSDNSPVVASNDVRNGEDRSPCAHESSALTHAYGCPSGFKDKQWGRHRGKLREPRASLVYFVLRTNSFEGSSAEGRADVLFQTMDTTWQAYNCWGGVNTYGYSCSSSPVAHAGSPPLATEAELGAAPRRATKVSFNRPFATRAYRAANMPFAYEYPMVRWLERNGFNVVYWTASDADKFVAARSNSLSASLSSSSSSSSSSFSPPLPRLDDDAAVRAAVGAELLDTHAKVYLSVGHDEYWSANQRHLVESARDAGMSLAFLSANSVFWKVRWEDSHRTMVVAKETHESADAIERGRQQQVQQLDEWTGTWRDGRKVNAEGPNPENALIGQLFTVNAWRNDALLVPLKRYGGNRLWRHTVIAEKTAQLLEPSGQQQCSSGGGGGWEVDEEEEVAHRFAGLLGHEVDEDVENGFRPPGLSHLSSSELEHVQYLVDEGSTYDTGSATHHLTLYRAYPSGSLVFGAGTCRWSWGLDGHHDLETGLDVAVGKNAFSLRVGVDSMRPKGDPTLQQATVNLFADMGVFPATLQPNLVMAQQSSDFQAPVIGELAGQWPHVLAGVSVIHGVASDEEVGGGAAGEFAGVVAGVEVSEDDGRTWSPAALTGGGENGSFQGTWSYRLRRLAKEMGQAGEIQVLVRAVDDSGNLAERQIKAVARFLPHMDHLRAN